MSPQSSDQGDGEAGFKAGGEFSLGPFSARAEFSSNPADSDESDENGGPQLAENSREEESVTSESQAEQEPSERDSEGSGRPELEWRSLSDEIRLEIADNLDLITRERYQQGSNRFGDRFQGDPIDHAVEEGVDSLFYLEMARRERANLIERIEMLEYELKELHHQFNISDTADDLALINSMKNDLADPPSSLKGLLPSNLEQFKELLGTASIDIDAENDEEDNPKYTIQLGPYKNVKVDLSDVLKADSLDGVLEMIQTKMLETASGEDEHDDS